MVTKWSLPRRPRVPDFFFRPAGLHFVVTIKINLLVGSFYSFHDERHAALQENAGDSRGTQGRRRLLRHCILAHVGTVTRRSRPARALAPPLERLSERRFC